MALSYWLVFQCMEDGREISRYADRAPGLGEFVSFLNPGGNPEWVAYEVKRVHTFFGRTEPKFVIEIQKCS